jgi:hypothetical protein
MSASNRNVFIVAARQTQRTLAACLTVAWARRVHIRRSAQRLSAAAAVDVEELVSGFHSTAGPTNAILIGAG